MKDCLHLQAKISHILQKSVQELSSTWVLSTKDKQRHYILPTSTTQTN